MSLIDLGMSDQERILFYSNKILSQKLDIFNPPMQDSYYTAVEDRIFPDIMEYDIDNIGDFREFLEMMWNESLYNDSKLLINIIMAAAYKNRDIAKYNNNERDVKDLHSGNIQINEKVLSFTKYVF
jgi:hypothetical protein